MADEDLETQTELATKFAAAIATLEPSLRVDGDALIVDVPAPDADGLDKDTVDQLLLSLAEANSQIAGGELALADLGISGEANA